MRLHQENTRLLPHFHPNKNSVYKVMSVLICRFLVCARSIPTWKPGGRFRLAYRPVTAVWPGTISFNISSWVAVMMPAFAGLPLLGFVLIGCYVMDYRTWPAAGLGGWLRFRLHLTLVASLSCFIAAGAT